MKKTLLLFAVCFLLITTASAQMKFGVKAGLNFANVGGDDAGNMDSKMGLVLGGYMTYYLSDMFALQPELLYSMKGATAEEQNVEMTLSLNYIEIPVLVKFFIPLAEGSMVKPAIFAGPAIGLNVSANAEQEFQGKTEDTDIKDNVSTLDFGLAFGAGIGFPVGSNELGLDIRYTLGLATVADVDGEDPDVKNNAFTITAFFGF